MPAIFRTARIKSVRRNNARIIQAFVGARHSSGGLPPPPPNANIVAFSIPDYAFRRRLAKHYPKRYQLPSGLEAVSPPLTVIVPNLIGLQVSTAFSVLANIGLQVVQFPQALADSQTPFGQVISQTPGGGTSATFQTIVDLNVQSLVIVPTLLELDSATALALLLADNLVGAIVDRVSSETPGTVIGQDTSIGAQVPAGTLITLTAAIPGNGFRVCAVTAGFYNGEFRRPGDVFDLLAAADFSDSTQNYEVAGQEVSFGWMKQVPSNTPLTQDDGSGLLFTADPNRRFVE